MTRGQFKSAFPLVMDWIRETLSANAIDAIPVASLSFPRLPLYYDSEFLAEAKVVYVDKCPVPPVSKLGLEQLTHYETSDAHGITLLDTYFVLRREAQQEALHFHELVHVNQWRILGAEGFLT